ncbi:MAG: hypothetical protein P4N59_24830 [Negativicutes bacterium]|nr:hypothetical protein [Negativicutes bacterium]
MQFKNWPFGSNETPVLYWMTSPRKSASGWVMDAVFKRQPEFSPRIVRVEVPWGTLPYLRIGRTYYDKGRLDETSKSGLESTLILLPEYRGKLMPAHAMPRELRSFYGDNQLSKEMVWVIGDGHKTYYIPCLELIRAFLASSVYMTNHLLFPTALEDMVSKEEVAGSVLEMVLNLRIPTTIANNSTAFHIAWLRHNQTARQMWNGILATQRYKARARQWETLEEALQSGVPLECEPPNDTKYVVNYRGFYSGDNWLVQEIISVQGFDIPFEEVNYSHPLLKTIRFEDDGNKASLTRTRIVEPGQEYEMDNQGGPAGPKSFQPRIIVSAVEFLAKKKIKIKRVSDQERTIKRNKDNGQTKDWRPSHKVTTQDGQYGGTLRPVEVRGISFVDYNNLSLENQKGLKEFMDAVNLIQEWQSEWNIQVEFVPVPEGTRISQYPSGERRMCAIIKIARQSKALMWLAEVARPDRWQISTLLLGENPCEVLAEDVQLKWLKVDGHWDWEGFIKYPNITFKKIKHSSCTNKWWAVRMSRKILEI